MLSYGSTGPGTEPFPGAGLAAVAALPQGLGRMGSDMSRPDDLKALVKLLNATEPELAAMASKCARVFVALNANAPDILPKGFCFDDEERALTSVQLMFDVIREAGVRIVQDGDGAVGVVYPEENILEELAGIEYPWDMQSELPFVAHAARGLFAVLRGEAKLARCGVPWQRGPHKGEKCGRVYVRKGPAGRPRVFCGGENCKSRRARLQPSHSRKRPPK